jgi:hypothetical protein
MVPAYSLLQNHFSQNERATVDRKTRTSADIVRHPLHLLAKRKMC